MNRESLSKTARQLSNIERVACFFPLALLLLGGVVGALWGGLAIWLNLLIFSSSIARARKLLLCGFIFLIAVCLYFVTAYALRGAMPQDIKEAIGATALVAGGLWFTFECCRGFWQAKALDPFSMLNERVERNSRPGRYFAAMTFWIVLTAFALWLAFAFLFFPHAA